MKKRTVRGGRVSEAARHREEKGEINKKRPNHHQVQVQVQFVTTVVHRGASQRQRHEDEDEDGGES